MPHSFFGLHIDWSLVVTCCATVGIPTTLLLYAVKRMRDLAGPHVELEPQHIVSVAIAFPTTDFSLQSLEEIVRRADFRSPETRRMELRQMENWLADRNVAGGDGYSMVLRQPAENQGPLAERLASAQIKRMETVGSPKTRKRASSRAAAPADENVWCVLGFIAAVAVSAAETIPEGDGADTAAQALDTLKAATDALISMDAFYLFYSPAPGHPLTEAGAKQLLDDLKKIATPKPL